MKPKTKAQLLAELEEMKTKLNRAWDFNASLRSHLMSEHGANMRLRAENAWMRRQLGLEKAK